MTAFQDDGSQVVLPCCTNEQRSEEYTCPEEEEKRIQARRAMRLRVWKNCLEFNWEDEKGRPSWPVMAAE